MGYPSRSVRASLVVCVIQVGWVGIVVCVVLADWVILAVWVGLLGIPIGLP